MATGDPAMDDELVNKIERMFFRDLDPLDTREIALKVRTNEAVVERTINRILDRRRSNAQETATTQS
jgi:hypothetical protein